MKIVYLKHKKIAFATMIGLLSLHNAPILQATNNTSDHSTEQIASDHYTDSIETICKHFDEIIMQNFKHLFKNSFCEQSTEKLSDTTKNLGKSHDTVKQFEQELQRKKNLLIMQESKNTNLYDFINTLLLMATDLESYFNLIYNALTTGLNKKLKAAAFAKKLAEVADKVLTDNNFNKIDTQLTHLAAISPEHVAQKINNIRSDVKNVLLEYKNKKHQNSAAALSMLRKRLPY